MNENKLVQSEKNIRPTFKTKVGSMDVAVWEKKGEKSKYFTVSFNKNYLDEEGKWQQTSNLMIRDLPDLQLALQKAYEFAKMKV